MSEYRSTCIYCGYENPDNLNRCNVCGKNRQIQSTRSTQSSITKDQIFWILFGGFSTFFILKYLLVRWLVGFPTTPFIAFLTSFIMVLRLKALTKYYKAETIGSFFPRFVAFFVLTGLFIWFLDISLTFTIDSNRNLLFDEIISLKIIPFSIEFLQGYSIGFIFPLFFYFFRNTKINVTSTEST